MLYIAKMAATMMIAGVSSKAQGGKFIDGVKGAAIGMAIGAAVNKVMGYFKPSNDINIDYDIEVPDKSAAIDNVTEAIAQPVATASDATGPPPEHTAWKEVGTVDPNFEGGGLSATGPTSAPEYNSLLDSDWAGASLSMEMIDTSAQYDAFNAAAAQVNQSIGRAAGYGGLACPLCRVVTGPVSGATGLIHLMGTGDYKTAISMGLGVKQLGNIGQAGSVGYSEHQRVKWQ